MKYSIGILTTITLIAALVFSGCNTQPDRTDRSQDAESSVFESDRDTSMVDSEVEAELRVYRTRKNERMEEYEQTIQEIEERIENESDDAEKRRLENKLDDLEESYNELKRDMDDYQASGRNNWEDFKDSFSSRMDDLGDSLDDFFSSSSTTSTSGY